jgi:hypothetical protein
MTVGGSGGLFGVTPVSDHLLDPTAADTEVICQFLFRVLTSLPNQNQFAAQIIRICRHLTMLLLAAYTKSKLAIINYAESPENVERRFRPWLERAIVKGLNLWRQSL